MASVLPKTTESGGISPRGWISALTGFEVLISVPGFGSTGVQSDVHPENQTQGEREPCRIRLVYVIDEKQLTKDCEGFQLVTGRAETRGRTRERRGKRFSHRRSDFPSRRPGGGVGANQ